MNLQEVFDHLSSGELSQLNIGGEAKQGAVLQSGYPALLGSINLGLTAIFRRFKLKTSQEVITFQANQLIYPLLAKDVLKIEQILTDTGKELKLNDSASEDSCKTLTIATLWVPAHIVEQADSLADDLKTASLTAVYRTNHPKLQLADLRDNGPGGIELELPDSHLQALLYFVASRLHTPLGADGNYHPGNSFYQRYEAECSRLEDEGVQIDQGSQVDRLHAKGFV